MDTAMMDPASLRARMTAEEEARTILAEYIDKNLKADVDYGAAGGRNAKRSLLKPGAEKITLLLQLRPHFGPDRATLAMAGNPPGLFAYVCRLIHTPTGVVIGEGRGAASLQERTSWTVNSAVKIAEKRAQVDAVLRVAALSDFFTQDLEDGAETEQARPQTIRAAAQQAAPKQALGRAVGAAVTQERSEPTPSTPTFATEAQQAQIRDLVGPAGMSMDSLLDKLEITRLAALPADKVDDVIARLQRRIDAKRAAQTAPDPNSPVADTPRLQAVR